MANVCLTKARRHPDLRDALIAALGLLAHMEIDVVEIDHGEALLLAEKTALTAYDASTLWLAEALNAELVTLDKRLATARSAPGA